MRTQLRLTLGLTAALIAFGYQNCGEFAVDSSHLAQFASLGASGSGGSTLTPDGDKLDPACLSSSAYDACVFKQNPVAVTSAALSSDPATKKIQLVNQAIYGVKLTSLTGNGKLENTTIAVRSLNTPLVATTPSALKSNPAAAGLSNFEQVNVYYWINRAAEYFDGRTSGALPAKGKAVQVIVDDTITGYETATNTIRMKMTDAGGAVAWNGDIAVHLFGIANLTLANKAGWSSLSTARHITCDAMDNGCCTSNIGCGNAIRFGVGEYFAASLFPDHTRIGEALVNTGNPQIVATVARDVASLATNTAPQIFTDSGGNSQAMGLLYAAIWWQVRAAAGTQSNEIDRIFLEHLTLINGNDDFKTAIAKAKTIDARLFSGRHSAKFDSQMTARGL